jgi:hypothetical protein
VGLAAALSIAQVAVPFLFLHIPLFGQLGAKGEVGTRLIVSTTAPLTPILWLVACAVIIVSYARRPATAPGDQEGADPDADVGTAEGVSEQIADPSPRGPRQAPSAD